MAERVDIALIDDLDGTVARHTLTFAPDGVVDEIDLNQSHAEQLQATLEPCLTRARPVQRSRRPRLTDGPRTPRPAAASAGTPT
jgi:hypothetical protein